MTRILITGAGGTPSTNFIRSIRETEANHHIIGTDCDPYCLQRAETDERFLVPLASDPQYLPVLLDIITQTKPSLVYSQPDPEILVLSQNRELLLKDFGVATFLPTHSTITLCQDKELSAQCWENHGIRVPRRLKLESKADIDRAFSEFGSPIWIRANYSPGGGRGAFRAESKISAEGWLDYCNGYDGTYCAWECLTPRSVTWMALYKEGALIVAQGRSRVYWEFSNRAPSGVTGITGAGITVSDPVVDDIAQKAVSAIDPKPNGIFAVDLTYDSQGTPNPTEINIGRFFTTHLFFTRVGINFPALFVSLALNEDYDPPKTRVNPLPSGKVWIRGMDMLPVLTDIEEIERSIRDLSERKSRLDA